MSAPDFIYENHGSTIVVQPMTPDARAFITEHVDVPGWAWVGGGFAVDSHALWELANIIAIEGFAVEVAA